MTFLIVVSSIVEISMLTYSHTFARGLTDGKLFEGKKGLKGVIFLLLCLFLLVY